ncbi:hypothetical protein B0H14DRAFT_3091931 [Mycena olivaceomarginata]|nr:hypothetical protein B0H14DRAFT_3091931 [Mycena olivaceomarginata]
MANKPPTDLKTGNAEEHHAAMELRDAVLRLRRDGAFIAVPLFRVNTEPIGPHPAGSYEIWAPSETFPPCFRTFILVHPLTRDQVNHENRRAWIGPAWPLDTSRLPIRSEEIPLQYPSLKVGYSSKVPFMNLEDRAALGANVEKVLLKEKDAARAPIP